MDLLGDLGAADQLTSARTENAVLTKMVKDLKATVTKLQIENQTLLAEVEMYRQMETSTNDNNSRHPANDSNATNNTPLRTIITTPDDFVRSGNGKYPSVAEVTLPHPHENANPLCCALSPDDTLVVTGGADSYLKLFSWGGALSPAPDAAKHTVTSGTGVRFDAPVICASFAPKYNASSSFWKPLVLAGTMSGSVRLASYGNGGGLNDVTMNKEMKHGKYVRNVAWSPSEPVFASGSADGTVTLAKVRGFSEEDGVEINVVERLHLEGAVEAMCFLDEGNTLCCYNRGTPYLSCFHLNDSMKQVKYLLNADTTGGFEGHVSFAVLGLSPSPDGRYLAAATDTSRNIILKSDSFKQVRNLYGHKNDAYSQPKIAWSSNGQYLFGNTQDDSSVCVWDISSSSIVKKLDLETCNGHDGQIRDMCSSAHSDTLVTVSYDKTAKVWLNTM